MYVKSNIGDRINMETFSDKTDMIFQNKASWQCKAAEEDSIYLANNQVNMEEDAQIYYLGHDLDNMQDKMIPYDSVNMQSAGWVPIEVDCLIEE